jgi:hypothetical protein
MKTATGMIESSRASVRRAARFPWAWLALPGVLWAAALSSQPTDPLQLVLTVDDHRPLAAIARELENRFQIVVTYEEGPWVATTDVEDVTSAWVKAAGPDKAPPKMAVIVPRRMGFSFEYDLYKAQGRPPDPEDLLTSLLRQYEAAGGPGRFRVEGRNGIYHLIPSSLKDAKGQWANASPVFSSKVKLADEERTVDDTLDEIVAQLNESSPVKIGWGFVPLNLFNQTRIRLAADGVPAREVLHQILEQLPRRVTWLLNYDPTTKRYYLSFLLLPGEPVRPSTDRPS